MCVAPNIRRRNASPSALAASFVRFRLAIFLVSILLAGAPQLRAQAEDSQQSAQDVAEAARHARARRQQPAKHVYTNEDLRRGKILTPEDQSRAAAANRKNSTAPVS